MSIIQQKAIGYWDFRSGTIDDLVGSNDGTFVSTPYFNREGLNFDGVDDYIDCGNNASLNVDAITVSAWVKHTTAEAWVTIVARGAGGVEQPFGLLSGAAAQYYSVVRTSGGASSTYWGFTPSANTWYHIVFSYDSVNGMETYVNGVPKNTAAANGTIDYSATTKLTIGSDKYPAAYFGGSIAAVSIFDSVLTATEVSQLYSEMKDTVFPTKPSAKSINKQKANINESGLVGAWDMKPVAGVIQDISSNNNTGTIYGNPNPINSSLGYALKLNGVDASVEASDASLNFLNKKSLTLSAWVMTNDTTGTHYVMINGINQYAYNFSIASNGRARIVIDSDFTGDKDLYGTSITLRDKQWHHIAATLGTNGTTSTLSLYVDGVLENSSTFSDYTMTTSNNGMYIGRAQGTYSNSTIANTEIYDESKSAAWVLSKYEKGASSVQYKGDYGVNVSDANVTSGQLENTGWTVDSGNWLINTDTIDGVKVKTFSCITDNGIIYRTAESMGMTTTENAYGTWEFYLYQQDSNNEIKIRLADVQDDTSATGYILKYGEDERWGMQAETAGSLADVMYTATGYFTTGTWYKMKVTRSTAGVWTCYRDGVLVDVTGGGSTNPVTHNTFTTAKYFQSKQEQLI
jgi:hypothetical protein